MPTMQVQSTPTLLIKMDTDSNNPLYIQAVPKLLLNAKEASAALGVCEKTLWSYTRTYSIPVVRIGTAVRYDVEDLKAFIQQRKEAG